jgi:MFS family permease
MHGVYLVWLVHERGFSPALVATVLAAGDLCVFALEVPTGWVADRLGHRVSLIIGSFVQVCAMLVFWLAATPPALLAASLLVAVGDASRSGADEALLYRSCAALGREHDFQAIEARTRSVGLIALVLLLVGGAVSLPSPATRRPGSRRSRCARRVWPWPGSWSSRPRVWRSPAMPTTMASRRRDRRAGGRSSCR